MMRPPVLSLFCYIVTCPHCSDLNVVYLNESNCHIFRHGVYKQTLKQIDPHLDKQQCDHLAANNLIYRYGKPFKIVKTTSTTGDAYLAGKEIYDAVMCGYL